MIAPRIAPLADWLAREGRFLPDNSELFSAFCTRLYRDGLPLARASMHLRALHPQYRGVSRVWRPGQPVEERFMDHGIEQTAVYLNSPVAAVVERGERLEWRLDSGAALPFPVLEELREQGCTHYITAPLLYSDGAVNTISWATGRTGGFAASDVELLDAVLPSFASIAEIKALRRFVWSALTTYVGEEPSRLILDGQVRRGDLRSITAALMLVDLRDFSMLSDSLSPVAVIRMLNRYFDCVMPPVRRHGGEVLELMGDGVLAIFNQGAECSATQACRGALEAAREGLAALDAANRERGFGMPELHAGAALHYGTVSYGNIGAGERLDFTVIGPDVNLTSRIERLCRELDRTLIMSEAFASTLDRPVWEIGHFQLRGFSRMQRLFELPPDET
ncbi:MAG: adenylate/guanylate cyclase domain-containing protein [Alphaproteobacteria bacterium]|nr:adenylate/guanylate cyclase domain-containing protein [Alphaproteobacteria bacterium]